MMIPQLTDLQKNITGNRLRIDESLVKHPVFPILLQSLKQDAVSFIQVEAGQEPGTKNLFAKGTSHFFSHTMSEAHFYLFEEPGSENGYEFEWYGTLHTLAFTDLSNDIVEMAKPLALIPGLLEAIDKTIVVLFTSADKTFTLQVKPFEVDIKLPGIDLGLSKIGFYYEKSLKPGVDTIYKLFSTIQLASTKVATEITLPAGNNNDPVCWSLKTTDITVLNNGLEDLVTFLSNEPSFKDEQGKSLLDWLPGAINEIPQFALTNLLVLVDPKRKSLQSIDLTIQSVAEFELMEGFVIKDVGVSTFVTFLEKSNLSTLSLFGRFIFTGRVEVGMEIQLPLSTGGDWTIAMDGTVELENLVDLGSLPFINLDALQIPPDWFRASQVHLENLEIVFNPGKGGVKTVDCSVLLKAESHLVPGIRVKDPYLKFNLTSKGNGKRTAIKGTIGTAFDFCGLENLWLEAGFEPGGWTFGGGTRKGQELSLKKVWKELVPGVELPFEMDLVLHDIDLSIVIENDDDSKNRNYIVQMEAAVKLTQGNPNSIQSQLDLKKIAFTYKKDNKTDKQTSIHFEVSGVADLYDAINITEFTFEYDYKSATAGKAAEWKMKGEMYLLAFQRLMAFKAKAQSINQKQEISFSFDSSQPILHEAYFKSVKGLEANNIMTALNGGKLPPDGRILISDLPVDSTDKIGDEFTEEQQTQINDVIKKAKSANEPLISIPDIFNNDNPLCTISPKEFKLDLKLNKGNFESIDFAITTDLVAYNNFAGSAELFSFRNAILSAGYNKEKKRFQASYAVDDAGIKPLSALSMLPGAQNLLLQAFDESKDKHPKTDAFINMLEIKPKEFLFFRQGSDWQLKAGIRLVLNSRLKTVDEDLYNMLERLFPYAGQERYMEGQLSINSREGIFFVLENNNGIEIPDFLKRAAENIDPQFKADLKSKMNIDLDKALEFGVSYLVFERFRIKIAKDFGMDMRLGIGLPSKLNDRLFNPSSEMHGLIKTYDPEKLKKAQDPGDKEYDAPFPDDNLLRVTLTIGPKGIGGRLDRLNMFNTEKMSQEFRDFLEEKEKHIIIDLNALSNVKGQGYGRLQIEKPTINFDLKTSAFTIGGGFELLSDDLKLPVRPVIKKLINLLPPDKFDIAVLNAAADKLVDHTSIHGIRFYDPATGKLSLEEFELFFRQFLQEESKDTKLFSEAVNGFLKEHSADITKHLPQKLLEFLSIKVPAGFTFNLDVPADKSISLNFEVKEPTPAQLKAGFSDCLQLLIPTMVTFQGIRLKKIGLGSGLFNQAIRLDLSAEVVTFPHINLAIGAGFSVIRQDNPDDEDIQHKVPDVKTFGHGFSTSNLMMFIFPQTAVPIPVPVFYDDLSVYAAGWEGSKMEMTAKFPRPELNVIEILKGLGNLQKFFKDKEFALPVGSYGVEHDNKKATGDSLLPTFSTGPVYMELPGWFGYEKSAGKKDGKVKSKILFGFRNVKQLDPTALTALVGNYIKFALRSHEEKKLLPIKVSATQSEYPINYLVKFLSLSERSGTKSIVLFSVFEANLEWALNTPAEFKKSNKQAKKGSWIDTQLQQIIPGSDNWGDGHDGFVLVLKGDINVAEAFTLETINAISFTTSDGLAAGIALRSRLANIFDLELSGRTLVTPGTESLQLGITGDVQLKVFDAIPVLTGSFSLAAGEQTQFMFRGCLDLLPDRLFSSGRSRLQLYTGTAKGVKSDITGLVTRDNISIGQDAGNGNIKAAGIHLEVGDFHLSGTMRIVASKTKQEWMLTLSCYGTALVLEAKTSGSQLLFTIRAEKAINIKNLLEISGPDNNSPGGKLVLNYPKNGHAPTLKEFYLTGKVSVFGLSSTTDVSITEDQFSIDLKSSLGILAANLNIRGKDFANLASFFIDGNITVLNDACRLRVNLSYFPTSRSNVFKGIGSLKFWGEERMSLKLEAGTTTNGLPNFEVQGGLDLSLKAAGFYLYSGTKQGKPSDMTGIISSEKLELAGGLYFRFAFIEASGTLLVAASSGNALAARGTLNFTEGILKLGNDVGVTISHVGNSIYISGYTTNVCKLMPDVVELGGGGLLEIKVNQQTQTVDLFRLTGEAKVLGISTGYTLGIVDGRLEYSCKVKTPLWAATVKVIGTGALGLSLSIDVEKGYWF